MDEKTTALLKAAQNILGSGTEFYEHRGEPKVKLWNDRWVLAELAAAVADIEGDVNKAHHLRTMFPAPSPYGACLCDDPFTEESLMCKSCEDAMIDTMLRNDAERMANDPSGDDYARSQR